MPLDFVPSEADNFGYPRSLIRCTTNWTEAVRAYNECKQFIFRRPDMDPAVFSFTDRVCSDKNYFPLLKSLHKFEFKISIDEDGHVIGHWNVNSSRTPEILQHKASNFLDGKITFKLNEIFVDNDAFAYIADIEDGIRRAESILGKGFTLFFRTNDAPELLYHRDIKAEVFGINDGPSNTWFASRDSFEAVPDKTGAMYKILEGQKACSIMRGDMCIIDVPHLPGVSPFPGGYKLWVGALKTRHLTA
jgi:hypothetical protein